MQSNGTSMLRIATIGYIAITLINAASHLVTFFTDLNYLAPGDAVTEPNNPAANLNEAVGGSAMITGNLVIILLPFMILVIIGLFTNRSWAVMGAMVTLGADIVIKGLNLCAELVTSAAPSDMLLAILLIAAEAGLLTLFYRYWRDNRRQTGDARQVESGGQTI